MSSFNDASGSLHKPTAIAQHGVTTDRGMSLSQDPYLWWPIGISPVRSTGYFILVSSAVTSVVSVRRLGGMRSALVR
jgi:hypothetical protein